MRKLCTEIITISNYNPFEFVGQYFVVLGMSVESGELEMAEQLLEAMERLPETQAQRYAQLIRQD